MVNRQTLLQVGSLARALVTLAIPIILSNLLQTGYHIADTFWVGRLGAFTLAPDSWSR